MDDRERHGFDLLGVSIGFLVLALVLAKTQFEFSDLIWLVSFVCQLLFGYQAVRFFGVASDSPELRILAAVVLAIFTYSFSYQVLLLALSPNLTWVVCHVAMVAVILTFERQRHSLRDAPLISKQYDSGFGHQALIQLGGALCILGTSAQWTPVLPLGMGIVIAVWLLSSKLRKRSQKFAMLSLLIGGAASSGWSWYVGRLVRGYWWVTSNDFQTAVSHAVLLSRFGMRDNNLMTGIMIKHHWSITGWAGMTNPWSHPETEVGVLTMLLLGFGLFLTINAWVLRIVGPDSQSRAMPLGVMCAGVGSALLSIGWASQQTVLGLMAFGCFGLVFADAVERKSPRTWVLVALLGAAGVWSNALTLPFLAVIVPVIIAASRLSDVRPSQARSGSPLNLIVFLSMVLLALGVVFWRFLFLPSVRSGAFELRMFENRDLTIPQLARLLPGPHLDEVRSLVIYLFVEHLDIAILFGFVLVVASKSRITLVRSIPILIGGLACVTAGFVLMGHEMGKFASWGSFMFTIALVTTLAIWIPKHRMLGQSWTSNLSLAVIGAAALTFPLLERSFLPGNSTDLTMYDPVNYYRIRLLVGGMTLLLITGVALTALGTTHRNLAVRLLLVWITGMLISTFVVSISAFVDEYRRDHKAAPTLSLNLLASREVREVSEWLKLNTDKDSIIASNYFCHVGKTCPSDTPGPIHPSMWGGGQADMSNLAAYSERRFYVQAFRHVFGNDRMSELARKRVQQSLDAAQSGDLGSLRAAGASYFVLDRASAPTASTRMTSALLYRNSRFSIYRIS